jgi:hypothetical protein
LREPRFVGSSRQQAPPPSDGKNGLGTLLWRYLISGVITMSFALYMVGFLIFLGGVVWGAVVAGVPHLYIGIGALIFLGIGIFSAVSKTRSKDPS